MVYYPEKDYNIIPDEDLLTFLFDSPHCWLKENDLAHVEAAKPDNYLTKAQIRTATKRLINVFRHHFGIGAKGPGEDVVVAISTGQIMLTPVFMGIVGAGGVYSGASTAFTPAELVRQIKQGASSLVIASEDCKEVAVKAAKECGVPQERVLVLRSNGGQRELRDVTGHGKNYCLETKEMDWARITDPKALTETAVCLLYSSGTTGPPKGVHVSHRNMVSESLIPQLTYREYIAAKQLLDPSWKYRCSLLAHLPTAHVAGAQGYIVNPFVAGGTVYWMPKFEFGPFLEYHQKFKITQIFTVPPIYLLIAKSDVVKDQLASIELAITGAAAMGPEVMKMVEPKLGCKRLHQTWGLSESTGCATVMPWTGHDPTGGLSPLISNGRMRITDDDDNDVPEGTEGEFLLKGPNITIGYWKNPTATRDAFTADGWFRSGDVGVCRGGKFYIVDRKKELIKYNALQIAPAELEALLLTHPDVSDAAVIGVPDDNQESTNELPRAYVVLADKSRRAGSGSGSEGAIKDFVRRNLASHKQLRGGVVYVDEIPKSPSGKILRRVLKEMAKAERAERRAKL